MDMDDDRPRFLTAAYMAPLTVSPPQLRREDGHFMRGGNDAVPLETACGGADDYANSTV